MCMCVLSDVCEVITLDVLLSIKIETIAEGGNIVNLFTKIWKVNYFAKKVKVWI